MNRQRHIREWLSVGTLAFTLAMLPGSTRADESAAETGDKDQVAQSGGDTGGANATEANQGRKSQVQIEEITVTARKREENIQATPVAITAFTEGDLSDRDVRNIQEITANVPTLQFDNATGNASSARIYLRGVGNGDPIGSDDPGVGIYVDGVFLPRSQGAVLTVSDVQQVEVLRGPQGTLFGKNTIGGAVSITSKKPDPSEFSGNASVRIGNYDRFDTRIAVNIPVVPERAAMRLSFATATRDAFTSNVSTGRDFGDDKLLAGRFQFLATPTDNLEMNFSFDRSIENRAPFGGKCKVSNTTLANGPGALVPVVNSNGTTVLVPGATTLVPGATLPTGLVGELSPGSLDFTNPNVALLDQSLKVTPGRNGVGLDADGDGSLSFGEADANGNGVIDSPASARSFAAAAGTPAAFPAQLARFGNGGLPSMSNVLQACAQDDARSTRKVASDLTSLANNLETFGSSFTTTYDFEDGPTFKSISSWRRNQVENRIDNDYTEVNFAQASLDNGEDLQDAFSQEFQLTGTGLNDRFNWVIGAYAFAEDIRGQNFGGLSTTSEFIAGQNLNFNFSGVPGGVATPIRALGMTDDGRVGIDVAQTRTNLAAVVAALNPTNSPTGVRLVEGCTAVPTIGVPCLIVPGAIQEATLRVKNAGYAGYTQGTYDFTDAFSMTVGARLTQERKRVRSRQRSFNGGFNGADLRLTNETDFEFERSTRFKDISPLINLSYQVNDETLLYTTFSRGFKSGGFNGRANDPSLTNEIADEKLISYEVGFKTSFLDNRIIMNGAAYFSKYQDIQLTIPQGLNGQASIAVLNAGQAEIKGGEFEFRWFALPSLELTGSLGVVNSRYTDFDDPNNSRASDRRLLATPNYTGNAAALYTIPAGSLGDLRLRTEWTHRGKSGTDVVDSEVLRKGKNGELDASITLALADGRTEFVVFGNNLLNREYFTNGVNLGDSLGIAYRFFNDPRTYGIEIRRQF